jgi:hypothetical protein
VEIVCAAAGPRNKPLDLADVGAIAKSTRGPDREERGWRRVGWMSEILRHFYNEEPARLEIVALMIEKIPSLCIFYTYR